jgi:hypothetical protein
MEDLIAIEFERTGGFTGIPVKIRLDQASLELEEIRHLMELITKSGFFETISRSEHLEGKPDQFRYRISIETSLRSSVVEFNEKQVSEDLQPLIQFLARKAKTRNQ